MLEWAVLLCHLSEAVAAPLSRGDSPKHGDRAPWLQRDPVFQQSPNPNLPYTIYHRRLMRDDWSH